MGNATTDIVAVEPPVKRDGFPVIPEQGGHGFFETAVTHLFFLTLFERIGNKNGSQADSQQGVSGNYGKRELATVAAFLPWRGLPVLHP